MLLALVGDHPAVAPYLPLSEEAVPALAGLGVTLGLVALVSMARRLTRSREIATRGRALALALRDETEAHLLADQSGRVLFVNVAGARLWPGLDPLADMATRHDTMSTLAGAETGIGPLDRLRAAADSGYAETLAVPLRPLHAPAAGEDSAPPALAEPEWWEISVRPPGCGDAGTGPDRGLRLWVATDITARRAIDEVLTREREALSDFLYFLPVGLYTADAEGRLRFVNQRMARWLNRAPEDLAGTSLSTLIDGGPPPLEDGDWRGELRFLSAGGQAFTAVVSQATYDDDGALLTRAVVLRDAVEAPAAGSPGAAEGGSWRWDRRFRWLFDGAPVGIALTDPEGRLTDCNRALETLLGQRRKDLVDQSLVALLADVDRAMVARAMDQVLSGAVTGGVRLDVTLAPTTSGRSAEAGGPDGRVTADLYLGPMGGRDSGTRDGSRTESRPGPAAVVEGVVAHLIDTTEQRSLERQFAQAQKIQAMGQLAGGVAHDFNNLLTAMIGFSDLLLQRHGAGDPSFADIMQIRQNANRAANLVRQLLAFSRRQPLQPRLLDVGAALSELSHLLRRLLGETIDLQLVHGRDVDTVRVDPGQFDQVIINLAVNARDAMPGGGTLTISTRLAALADPVERGAETMPAGTYVVIDVRDTGKGIDDSALARIFEPFFTTKHGSAVGAGTGLGLSTVYGILRQTGGFIAVESAVGRGTCFTIHLPRAVSNGAATEDAAEAGKLAAALDSSAPEAREPRPDTGAGAAAGMGMGTATAMATDPLAGGGQGTAPATSASAPAPPRAGGSGPVEEVQDLSGAETILLVEDEDAVRIFAARALRNKGYAVLEAHSGEGALDLLRDTRGLALLITDMVMPGMDGATLARLARVERPDLRVIMISGYSEDMARGDILEQPNIRFLSKPFSLKRLAETVKQVLAESEDPEPRGSGPRGAGAAGSAGGARPQEEPQEESEQRQEQQHRDP
ncbi:PAS domain-containing hybrid sensor histidine kinase/response regulator [Roseospira visakhapatnamensis]|uniref:histidine kinase n=1 Tax=Roseospira visakhapatnamensis TaxID=390880 RepID=A0A7W6REY0_9PROT|nr:ATP-binding protein [Roseospira visakhapatnamensis]MBB4266789.1 two-component system cell cycle sensor histidine kinase/response regulator CckA [Roseospira visakhapatnamensis]